jgi:hypothetical protein
VPPDNAPHRALTAAVTGRIEAGLAEPIIEHPVPRQGYPHPIAYTFEASEHCPVCTAARFGVDSEGWIPEDATDGEGNPVGAVAPWDEWDRAMTCGTCGGHIADGPEGSEEE